MGLSAGFGGSTVTGGRVDCSDLSIDLSVGGSVGWNCIGGIGGGSVGSGGNVSFRFDASWRNTVVLLSTGPSSSSVSSFHSESGDGDSCAGGGITIGGTTGSPTFLSGFGDNGCDEGIAGGVDEGGGGCEPTGLGFRAVIFALSVELVGLGVGSGVGPGWLGIPTEGAFIGLGASFLFSSGMSFKGLGVLPVGTSFNGLGVRFIMSPRLI